MKVRNLIKMGMNLFKLSTIKDFKDLIGNEELLVVWNDELSWSKEMRGKKIYDIIEIARGSVHSPYPDEIILKHKGNIFFNFRLFISGESKIVKEVFLLQSDA